MTQYLKLSLLLLIFSFSSAIAQDEWPKEIPAGKGGIITIYQPSLEKLEQITLTGRAAVSYRKSAKEEPVFGVIWFKALLSTDKDSRMATLDSIDITKTKFSTDTKPEQLAEFEKIVETEVMKWDLEITMDEIITSLEEKKNLNDPYLKNDPPEIIYRDKPATLVLIDGQPIVKMDEQLKMERVMNSTFLIVKTGGKFYTYTSGLWYESADPLTGHAYVKSIPKELQPVHQKIEENEKKNNNGKTIERPTTPPEVIVRTSTAELLQTDGEPKYAVIEGTNLLYVDNSLDEIFKDVATQRTYVLLSGRWFSATSLKGPWTYVPSSELPADFKKIPAGSEKDGVLVSVAGTPEAEEAKVDAQIPQTAKVDRKTAKVDVKFDGTPKFSAIENTSLQLAENSNVTVIRTADGKFYAVENGVWFVSNAATGPYAVSDTRPSDLDKIPPDNAAYNTKYVYIYDTSPQYVYVGYTPGYFGTYVYGPTIVYGTGYYYHPWYGAYYYPRPVTYGFGMSYNPWTGWSMHFGMSYNMGWYGYGGVHVHVGGYGGYYRPPYRHYGYNGGYYGHGGRPINSPNINVNRPVNINTGDININSNNNNIYKNVNGAQTRDLKRAPDRANANVGKPSTRPSGGNQGGNRPSTQPTTRPSAPVSGGKPSNQIYSGKDGNVYQRDNNGSVQQRDNNQWKSSNNQATHNMQSQQSRGQMRNNNYNQQRPTHSAPASRPSGGGSRPSGGSSHPAGNRR
jgi:hypothetical protein